MICWWFSEAFVFSTLVTRPFARAMLPRNVAKERSAFPAKPQKKIMPKPKTAQPICAKPLKKFTSCRESGTLRGGAPNDIGMLLMEQIYAYPFADPHVEKSRARDGGARRRCRRRHGREDRSAQRDRDDPLRPAPRRRPESRRPRARRDAGLVGREIARAAARRSRQADGAHLRQLHVTALPPVGRPAHENAPAVWRPRDVPHGLHPRGAPAR